MSGTWAGRSLSCKFLGLSFADEVAAPPVKFQASRLKRSLRFGVEVFGFRGFGGFWFQEFWGFNSTGPVPGPYQDMVYWGGRILSGFKGVSGFGLSDFKP